LSYMNKVPAYNYYRLSYMNKVPEQLSFGQWPYIAKYYHIRIKCHAPYMWKTYWGRF
jgi:hypothetical protein